MQIPEKKIHRFPAVPSSPGSIGCALSHLNLLMFIKQKKYVNTIILEDDFEFTVSREKFNDNLNKFFETIPKYDIVMLSYNLKEASDFNELCGKVINGQTTSGYMIHHDFLDILIDVYKEAVVELIKSNGKNTQYVCDQSWKILQPTARWYYFIERIGQQRESYSDIENKSVNYNL